MKFSRQEILRRCCAPLVFSAALLSQPLAAQENPAAAPSATAGAITEVSALSNIPVPNITAKAWLIQDANSGQIIASSNPNESVEPASLTKLMAAYVIFDALENGRLKLDQKVHISEKAWKTEGSRMFVDVNSEVSVDELLQGVIVQSGNDATVALAEALAGSESAFVAMMNQQARALGMRDTNYVNSPGLPDPEHFTTVQDLALLARALVQNFPQYMHYYSQKEFRYNKINQGNRNRLLWADATVDGLKTGHTQSAGYCLVSTALRDGRRVISVLVGAPNEASRNESSLKLLNWGFRNFDTVKLLDADKPAVAARIWEGEAEAVELGIHSDLWVTVPRERVPDIRTEARYTQPLLAPVAQDSAVGSLVVTLDGQQIARHELRTLNAVDQAGFFGRLIDKIRLLFE